jgi:hypothetical protein
MANLTRILNNQIYSKTIIASQKIADGTITGTLFASNVTVPGDFLITGNLFVLGSSAYTTIASTNTYVNDPLIVLNNGFAGTNTYDEGFVFNRGTLQNRALIWSEYFQEFRLIGTTESGTTYGNVVTSNFANLHIGNLIVDYTINHTGNFFTNGFINTTANVSAAVGVFGAINSTGLINTTGNVSASTVLAQLVTADDATFGNVVAGFIGNTGTAFTGSSINLSGNVSATELNIGTIKATGLINTTGNVSASQLNTETLVARNNYGNINLTQFNSIFADANGSQNIVAIQLSTTGLSDGMGMLGTTGLDSSLYSTKGIAFRTGVTVRNTDTPTGGVIKVAITAAGDLWANATTPASNTTTGAFVVKGGVGIGGNLYVGAGLQATTIGNVTPAEAYFTNVAVSGNIITGLLQAAAINSTPIGNATASTGAFTTLSAANSLWANASISTTTQGTGAIVVPNGGISVSGAANIGGTLTAGGATQLNSTLAVGGITTFTNTTNATTPTNGAVIIQGGASVTQDLWVGGNIYAGNIFGTSQQIITVKDPLLYLDAANTYPYSYDIGFYSNFVGPNSIDNTGNVYQHTSLLRDNSDNTWKFVSNIRGEPTAGGLPINSDTIYDPVRAGNLVLVRTDDSTSATTGALQVGGGAGIAGNIFHTGTRLETSASNYLFATTPTTVDAFKAATDIEIGATTGTILINNPTLVGSQTTQNLYNTVADTINFGRAANITLGINAGTTTVQGNLTVQSVKKSTAYNNGALTISGGLGVDGNIFVNDSYLDTTQSNFLLLNTPTVVDAFKAGTDIEIGATSGTVLINNPTLVGSQATQALYNTVASTLNFARAANITMGHTDGTTTLQGNANVRAVTQSTSFTNGALVVAGGLGVASNVNIKGSNYLTLGKDIAGGLVYPENTVQITANANSAARISIQNISTSQQATSEFIAIADNGSNVGTRVVTGIASTTFNSAVFSPIIKPNDGYTYADGNLVLAAGLDLVVGVGGTSSVGVRVSNTNSNVGIQYSTESTTEKTGALTVVGGVGINKDLYVGKGATFNSTRDINNFQILSSISGNIALYANVATNYGASSEFVVVGGANVQVQPGVAFKVGTTTTMMVPVGPTGARPSSLFGNATYDKPGMIRFNSTINNLEFFDGTNWAVTGSTFTVISDRQFSGNVVGGYGNVDGTNTVFTLQSTATTSGTIISINGVIQFPTLAYSVSGDQLTFTEPPAPDDVIDARVLTTTTTVASISNGNGANQFLADDQGLELYTGPSGGSVQRVNIDTGGNINILTGSKVTYNQTPTQVVNNNLTLLDSFSANSFSTAKYIISMKQGTGNVQAMEALLTQSTVGSTAGTAYITTYGIVNTGNTMGTLAANVNVSGSWTVNMWLIPNNGTAISNVKVMTTYIV